jgi:hypothetical protein
MEIATSTKGTSTTAISQGLLVREMATGNVQLGYDDFVQSEPAPIPILGTTQGDPNLLTYADFADPVATVATDRIGQPLDEWIAPGGIVSTATPPVELLVGHYEPITGHNVAQVTMSWLEGDPFGINTNDALGLPISEPYWIPSGKGEAGVSLVQLFERRVVLYTPDLPLAERFSLTSVGRHYYRWRYGNDPGVENSSAAIQRDVLPRVDAVSTLSLPDGYQARAIENIGDVFDIAVSPEGKLTLGYRDGRIELLDPRNPNAERTVFVEHLANPVAFTWVGTDFYVIDDRGLHRFHDRDANGVADDDETIISGGFERASVQLAQGPDATLYLIGSRTADNPSGTPTTSPSMFYRVSPETQVGDEVDAIPIGSAAISSLVVDDDGIVWLANPEGEITRFVPDTENELTMLDAAQFSSVHDLVLYRPDGTSGDPYRDMLALADGRIVRLQPSRPDERPSIVTPSTTSGPAAIVDFITDFDRPTAMAAGLDGSLYVLDSGRGVIYQIGPK